MQTDPIADFLTRVRNAAAAKHQRVDVPVSKLKTEIARILKEEGYISTYKMVDENKSRKTLRVFLKYTPDRRSVITGVKRISRPGQRSYLGATEIKPGRRRPGHQHFDHAERLDDAGVPRAKPRSAARFFAKFGNRAEFAGSQYAERRRLRLQIVITRLCRG